MTHKQRLEETSRNLDDDDFDGFGEGSDVQWTGSSAAFGHHSIPASAIADSGSLAKDKATKTSMVSSRLSDWRR